MSQTSPAIRRALVAAVVLSSATLIVPAASAQSVPGVTEFSSQQGFDPHRKAAPRVMPKTGGPVIKGPVGVPRTNFAPRSFKSGPSGPGGPAAVIRGPGSRGPGFRGPAVGFRGPLGITTFHGRRANFIRGPHRFFRNGAYIPFVALGTLAAITIGSRYYVPYAYVDGPGADVCAGPTDDGMCELRMTEVPLEDGTAAMQCVSYCPQ